MQPSSLPPVVIPQGMDLIANAMGSPYPGLPEGFLPPTTPGGGVRRAAPEPNKRALYIGGLDQRVTEEVLSQIFETAGHVISVKIIPDKNVSVVPLLRLSCLLGFSRIGLSKHSVMASTFYHSDSCIHIVHHKLIVSLRPR